MFSYKSIEDYHRLLLNGGISCVDVVRYYLQRIADCSHLNAWLEVYDVEALERAQQLDESRIAGKNIGKLHGVIFGLKDVISFKGHHLSASSKILENFISVYNATATQRILDEGGIILGRQNCDEFAMGSSNENSAYGVVKNAVDNERVPGGSSGGSAVAVQSGMCMISLGSDTGGSVRQPADLCGIIGFKPSYGTVSRHGLIAYASSFDQIGIFASSVSDVERVLEVIGGKDEYDSTVKQNSVFNNSASFSTNHKFRFCYFSNALEHASLHEEISSSIKKLIETLVEKGHTVEPIDFQLFDHIVPTYYVLTTAEASSNLSRYDGVRYGTRGLDTDVDLTTSYKLTRSKAFGSEVKRRILLGTFVLSAGYYDAYFTKAQQVRRILTEKTKSLFENYDAVILPTVPTPAFKLGEKTQDPIAMFLADIYTVYANLVGIPAISLPLFKTKEGLPFGLQLMTSQQNDLLLLSLSKQLMQ